MQGREGEAGRRGCSTYPPRGGHGVDAEEDDTATAWRQGHCRHSEGEEGADRGGPVRFLNLFLFIFLNFEYSRFYLFN